MFTIGNVEHLGARNKPRQALSGPGNLVPCADRDQDRYADLRKLLLAKGLARSTHAGCKSTQVGPGPIGKYSIAAGIFVAHGVGAWCFKCSDNLRVPAHSFYKRHSQSPKNSGTDPLRPIMGEKCRDPGTHRIAQNIGTHDP